MGEYKHDSSPASAAITQSASTLIGLVSLTLILTSNSFDGFNDRVAASAALQTTALGAFVGSLVSALMGSSLPVVVGKILLVIGVLLLFASALTYSHVAFNLDDSLGELEDKQTSYWAAFGVAIATAVVVPVIVFVLKIRGSSTDRSKEQSR